MGVAMPIKVQNPVVGGTCPLQVDEVERSDCHQAKCSRQDTLWTTRACSPHPSTETKAFTEAYTYTKSVTSAHVGEMRLAI